MQRVNVCVGVRERRERPGPFHVQGLEWSRDMELFRKWREGQTGSVPAWPVPGVLKSFPTDRFRFPVCGRRHARACRDLSECGMRSCGAGSASPQLQVSLLLSLHFFGQGHWVHLTSPSAVLRCLLGVLACQRLKGHR